ncbi:MAG: hypothetical protein Kow00129_14670 [Thermoleophilia bacterium]
MSDLHILITNDDGIRAAGLLALRRALLPLGEVSVIAPDRNRSGTARSITMRKPLTVEEVELPGGGRGYATDGTPVDCVRMGALGLLERPPDLIVSGINLGGNLGDDITYSGTVAAAFEGIMLDTPAIAVSADDYHEGYDLTVPARVAAHLVRQLLEHGFPPGVLLNVNCPDVSWEDLRGVRVTTLGRRIYGDKVQLDGEAGGRRRYFIYGDDISYHEEEGTDFDAVAQGYVSVTPLHFELTSHRTIAALAGWTLDPREAEGAPAGPADGASERKVGAADKEAKGRQPLAKKPQAVIFDLDGTLFDSVELIVASFAHAVRDVLGLELPREQLIANVGKPLREQMNLLDADQAEDLLHSYREFNHREHDRMTRLFPGAEELLEDLVQEGVKLGLVTSKSRATTQMAFRLTNIEPYFSVTVCAEDTVRNKPDPEPLLYALERLRVAPEEAVYVGDSPFDVRAARAAGIPSVGVGWGVFDPHVVAAEGPDRMVNTMDELRHVLKMESAGVAAPPGESESE